MNWFMKSLWLTLLAVGLFSFGQQQAAAQCTPYTLVYTVGTAPSACSVQVVICMKPDYSEFTIISVEQLGPCSMFPNDVIKEAEKAAVREAAQTQPCPYTVTVRKRVCMMRETNPVKYVNSIFCDQGECTKVYRVPCASMVNPNPGVELISFNDGSLPGTTCTEDPGCTWTCDPNP